MRIPAGTRGGGRQGVPPPADMAAIAARVRAAQDAEFETTVRLALQPRPKTRRMASTVLGRIRARINARRARSGRPLLPARKR